MLFFWNFYSTKNAEQNKKYHSFHKMLISTTVYKIDNNKFFLSSKSAYWNDFWRIMWYWRLEQRL